MAEKKSLEASDLDRRKLVEPEHSTLSIRRQCELLELPRSTYYYEPTEPDPED